MTARIVSLFPFSRPKIADWSQQELSEFYRVESALVQAGMRVETDRGVSDEGDPWFVFCREEDGEVIVHFARLDGRYIVSSPTYTGVSTGDDFGQLVKDLMSRHPLVHSGRRSTNSNVFLHPTALLVALVATAFFKSGQANAHDSNELDAAKLEQRHQWTSGSLPILGGSHQVTVVALEASHVAIVISAAIFAMTSANHAVSEVNDLAPHLIFSMVADPDPLSANVATTISTSADQDRSGPTPDFDNLHPAEMQHGDVLKLLSVIAVLSDLVPDTMPDNFAWDTLDQARSYDEIAFHSLEDSALNRTSSVQGSSEQRPAVVLELVKSSEEFPSITSMETSDGERVQNLEIVLVLPQVLQPFLAQSVHLTSSQTSDGVLLALDIETSGLLEVAKPDPGGSLIPASPTPASDSVASQADGPSEGLDQIEKARVVNLIENFINHTPDYKVLIVDHNVIFYDVYAVNAGDSSLRTMTWDFADGISISLVAPSSNFSPELFDI